MDPSGKSFKDSIWRPGKAAVEGSRGRATTGMAEFLILGWLSREGIISPLVRPTTSLGARMVTTLLLLLLFV